MPTHFSYDVFISYSSSDLAFAEQLHIRLVDAGFRVWFDKARLNPGCDWHKEIEIGCDSSRVILPVLTPRWKESKWTKFETYGADCVIPLIAEGQAQEVFTAPLGRFQAQQIDIKVPDDAQWQRLVEAIRSQLEKTEPDKVQRLADVRYQANPHFVGREAELLQIHEELHNSPTAVLTQGRVRAIAALGGVGKTTLAREYIEQFWRCYSQIFWVDCRKGVETELGRICDLILPQYQGETDVPAKAKLAYQELLRREERLLIYDNAEDEVSLQAWIPKSGHCRTLITSRFSAWSAAIKTIHLYVLDPEPAWALLVGRAGRGSLEFLDKNEQNWCKILAEKLGYLPLALEQAAAYIEQQGAGYLFADYVRLYESATAELLAAGVLGSTEYPDSVITTWKATIAKLTPQAQAILRLCSFMASTRIPISVLVDSAIDILDEAAAPQTRANNNEALVREHTRQLRAYSMVNGDGKYIQLHSLVQVVERLQAKVECKSQQSIQRVLQILYREASVNERDKVNWPRLELVKPHILASVSFAESEGAPPEVYYILLGKIGSLDFLSARYAEAEPLMRRVVSILESKYGAEHAEVATALGNLATLLKTTNRLIEAEALERRALAVCEKIYGPEHSNVAVRLGNLAQLLLVSNRLGEAEPIIRRALGIAERLNGPEHPNVVSHLGNLAQLLQSSNRLNEAEELVQRALFVCEKAYGPDHEETAVCLGNLAFLFSSTCRLEEAEPLMRRALAILELIYGGEHPNLAAGLNNLSQLLQESNRLEEAETLMRRVLSIDEKAYGSEHPRVAGDLNNLAQLLQATNRLNQAEPLLQKSLSILEASYGPEHPEVATTLSNLAVLLFDTNRVSQAEPLMRRSLEISERALGPDHPDVATKLNNIANLLRATNRLAEAELLARRAVSILNKFRKSTGHEHPNFRKSIAVHMSLIKSLNLSKSEIDQIVAELQL